MITDLRLMSTMACMPFTGRVGSKEIGEVSKKGACSAMPAFAKTKSSLSFFW